MSETSLSDVFDKEFAFNIGQVVRHKAEAKTKLVIIERNLAQDGNGFMRFYSCSLFQSNGKSIESETVILPESALQSKE